MTDLSQEGGFFFFVFFFLIFKILHFFVCLFYQEGVIKKSNAAGGKTRTELNSGFINLSLANKETQTNKNTIFSCFLPLLILLPLPPPPLPYPYSKLPSCFQALSVSLNRKQMTHSD